MLNSVVVALVAALAATSVAAAPAAEPVEVMVLGAYHFGNPGRDTNNMAVDSVLTPQKQRELKRVAAALSRFKPTHVMVEMQSDSPGFAIGEYDRFDDAMLAKDANEIVQIGYRTARVAGLKTVNRIDEQPKNGEPDYYPYDKVQETAAKFGQTAALDALNAPVAALIKDLEAKQKKLTVGQMLTVMNKDDAGPGAMNSYYGMLTIGDRETQTGADLNAGWYLRNAKIFDKLMQIAKPSDRVLVVFGGDHKFWLEHFAGLTPGYRKVDVLPYLARAK